MVYGEFGNHMREVIKTLHSIDRNLSIIVKDIEKKNQKGFYTNDIMKKYFGKFFKPKNKEYILGPINTVSERTNGKQWKPFTYQDIDDAMNKSRAIVNDIYDEAHKLRY